MSTRPSPPPEELVEPLDTSPLVPRRKIADAEMDITPMIDITFLLLIFFLVASRLDEDAPVELPPARHGTAVAENSSVIITVAASGENEAAVYLGDGKSPDWLLATKDPTSQEEAIVNYLSEGLKAGKTSVVIKAEKGVKHREVARVSSAVGKAGPDELYVAVVEVQ